MRKVAKVGLVLSGGGAKGAYQVGVVKGLVALGIEVDVIAGASIGALNGGVIACAGSLTQAAGRLEALWETLAEETPISVENPLGALSYLVLLSASGLKMKMALLLAQRAAQLAGIPFPVDNEISILSDKPLQRLLSAYLDVNALERGLPLHVSVFMSSGGFLDIAQIAVAEAGLLETPDSQFLHVQSLPLSEQKNALLASAALPLLYQPRKVNGKLYADGGQGGWSRAQGNTPITPLLHSGCDTVIVTHLSDGSLWSRYDYPHTTIIEIRPQTPIARDSGFLGGPKDLLGFDTRKIRSWIDQGYHDTLHSVGRIMNSLQAYSHLQAAEQARMNSEAQDADADAALSSAMSRLRSLEN